MHSLNFSNEKQSVKVTICNICHLDGSECICREESKLLSNFLDSFSQEISQEENNV